MTRLGASLACLMLAACESASPPPPIAVYLYGDESTPLVAELHAFALETGQPVELHFGPSGALTEDVIANRESPPADILMTSNVADIWRAAEKGALRPINAGALDAIADIQKDPDRYWVGVRVHRHLIVSAVSTDRITSYDELGTAGYSGRLCLSSSKLAVNRSLIAYLIDARGERAAERLVRRWIRNLARAPFTGEDELIDAVRDGRCGFAIASSRGRLEGLEVYSIPPYFFDVSAVGIGRHTGRADAAQRFVDWLLRGHVEYFTGDLASRPVRVAGWLDDEARLLAERAGYR